jgi:hypothetical protein
VSWVSTTADDDSPTLADLGVSYKESPRWQAVASVPEDAFMRYLAEVNCRGLELTSAGLMRFTRRLENQAQQARNPAIYGEDAGSTTDLANQDAEQDGFTRVPMEAQQQTTS